VKTHGCRCDWSRLISAYAHSPSAKKPENSDERGRRMGNHMRKKNPSIVEVFRRCPSAAEVEVEVVEVDKVKL